MHDQQILPDATNLNTHLRIGNVRGEERNRKRPPSAPEIPRHQGRGLGWRIHESVEDTKLSTNKQHTLSPGVLKIGVVHKEERDLKTG